MSTAADPIKAGEHAANVLTGVQILTTAGQQSTGAPAQACVFCGGAYLHQNTICPKIAAIEYFPDGTIKKITLR